MSFDGLLIQCAGGSGGLLLQCAGRRRFLTPIREGYCQETEQMYSYEGFDTAYNYFNRLTYHLKGLRIRIIIWNYWLKSIKRV